MFPVILVLRLCAGAVAAQTPAADSTWNQRTEMVPMRDGVRLNTIIVQRRGAEGSAALPFLLVRTPYGADGPASRFPGPYRFLAADGYIFVFQDIRGRGKSEGDYLMNRPLRAPGDTTGFDEASDTYDTVDWLIHNVPNNNGRVGGLGISYPGWLATMQGLSGHPAMRAVSPQAPMTDTWMGDDFFHQGAFRQSYGVEYTYGMEVGEFDVGVTDMYDWYRRMGILANIPRLLGRSWPSWDAFIAHPGYDAYWQSRATQRRIRSTPVAVLTVGGWYDQEDIFGPPATYAAFEKTDTVQGTNRNRIVMGPWNHGGWYGPGVSLSRVQFGDSTGVWFRREVEAPFFAFYLKDRGPLDLPEALVFEGGSNKWRRFDAWPPRQAATKNLYFGPRGHLSFEKPVSPNQVFAADSFVADPDHPVPYRPRPIEVTYSRGSQWNQWQAMDQRFVEGRPDVLSWSTEPLTEDVVIAGNLSAELYASTTGSDADWVVKLIDVYPDTAEGDRRMGGYELMVAGEIMRGRYRKSFDLPTPIMANHVFQYTVHLPPQAYRFQKGHRIMVQVQSSWFPLYDRNPQTFVTNIFKAQPSDFQSQTHRIWRSSKYPSHLVLPVLPN